jgi:hypothetical protein
MSKDQLKLDEWDIVKWLTVVSDDYCMERCLEAADEIKRLRAENEQLRGWAELAKRNFIRGGEK